MGYLKKYTALILCIALYLSVASCAFHDNEKGESSSEAAAASASDGGSSFAGYDDTTDESAVSSDDETSDDSSAEDSDETSDDSSAEVSEETSIYEQSADSEEPSEDDSQTEESSGEVADAVIPIISPALALDKVWDDRGMELYNTDFRISDELLEKFAQRFSSFSNPQSVALISVDTDMMFCYSKDTKIATASSIKGPMALFLYRCIDEGLISWDDTVTYMQRHFQENSTGNVQNSPFGTEFTVKTLMDYMVRISDNQAYLMLKEFAGVENFEQMMAALGNSRIIPKGSNWGNISALEMARVWREIYYYSSEKDSGAELLDRFMHAQYNYIWRAIPQYEAAHKSGWSGKAFNDAGIVYADGHQYVLVVLMGRSGTDDQRSHYQFNFVTQLLAELMVEYNAYLDSSDLGAVSESFAVSDDTESFVVSESAESVEG